MNTFFNDIYFKIPYKLFLAITFLKKFLQNSSSSIFEYSSGLSLSQFVYGFIMACYYTASSHSQITFSLHKSN